MSNPLDILLPQPTIENESWHWATVTSISPLRVRLDGDDSPLLATPENLAGPLSVGTRVWVQRYGRRVLVHSSVDNGTGVADTGWVGINLNSGYEHQGTLLMSWRRIGIQVFIAWGIANTGIVNGSQTIATLPPLARPARPSVYAPAVGSAGDNYSSWYVTQAGAFTLRKSSASTGSYFLWSGEFGWLGA